MFPPDFRENPEQRRRAEFGRSWRIELTVRVCPSRPWLKFLRARVPGRSVQYVRGRSFVALGLILLSQVTFYLNTGPEVEKQANLLARGGKVVEALCDVKD
jgi:hypothetical protein